MRTGAIFARGSCRALKWMALFGVVFLLGLAGEASAQTVTIHTMANDYREDIAVVEFSQPVWGNVPVSAFTVSGNSVVSITGLRTASPGSRQITLVFNADLSTSDTLAYTQPSDATRRLKMADGADTNSDPDDVATFTSVTIAEEINSPVLPAIADVPIMSGTAYTTAMPAATLPSVMGASGVGTITYTVSPASPILGLTVETTAGTDLGKIHGTTTAADGTVVAVTWTATDTGSRVANGQFNLVVQQVPGMPGGLTPVAGDASVMLSWTVPTTGGAVTGYQYRQDNGAWRSTGGTATTFTVTGLTNGTSYAFQVRAVNTAGSGPASSAVAATPVAAVVAPGKPGTLTAVAGNGFVDLSWSAPTTGGMVVGYEYEQNNVWRPTGTGTATAIRVPGLTNGTLYTFRVRGVNAAGEGEASDIATATPAAGPPVGIRSVSLGTINEGGQAQATVSLAGPVPAGQFVRVKLRLVGKLHTRQNTPSGVQTGGPFSATPSRQSGGVRTYLSGELAAADYDAYVAGELTIQAGQSSGQVTVNATTDDDAEDEVLLLQAVPDNKMFNRHSDSLPTGGKERLFWIDDSHEQGYALTAVPASLDYS